MMMIVALASAMAIAISVEAVSVPVDQVGQTLMRSQAPLSVSVDQFGRTLMRNKALTGSEQKRLADGVVDAHDEVATDVDAQASASFIAEEGRINKVSVIADSRRVCSDTAGFVDGQAFACEAWSGFDCFKAFEDSADTGYNYSQQGEDDILANCRASCGLCPRGGSQQQANCVQVNAGEVAPESGTFTSADGTHSNVAVTAGMAAPAAGLLCPMAKRCQAHEVCFVGGKDASSTYCNIDNGCVIGGCDDPSDTIDGTCPRASNNEEPGSVVSWWQVACAVGVVIALCGFIACFARYLRPRANGGSGSPDDAGAPLRGTGDHQPSNEPTPATNQPTPEPEYQIPGGSGYQIPGGSGYQIPAGHPMGLRKGQSVKYLSLSQGIWMDCEISEVNEADHAVQVHIKPGVWILLADQQNQIKPL